MNKAAQELSALAHASMTKAQRIARATKASKAAAIVRSAKAIVARKSIKKNNRNKA